jgi:hypothetical protein
MIFVHTIEKRLYCCRLEGLKFFAKSLSKISKIELACHCLTRLTYSDSWHVAVNSEGIFTMHGGNAQRRHA